MKMVIDMAKPLSQARWTDDVAYRFTQINEIFLIMWPIIKEALDEAEQQQNQTGAGNPQSNSNGDSSDGQTGSNGNPGSGNPNSSGNTQSMNHSAAAIQAVVNGLAQTASNTGANAAPQNQSTSKVASANRKQAQKGQQAQGGQKTSPRRRLRRIRMGRTSKSKRPWKLLHGASATRRRRKSWRRTLRPT